MNTHMLATQKCIEFVSGYLIAFYTIPIKCAGNVINFTVFT